MKESSNDNNLTAISKARWIKILAPILIVVIIAGIYLLKNPPQAADSTSQSPPPESKPGKSASIGVVESNTNEVDYHSDEFDLDATDDLDLDELLSYGLPVIIDFGSDSCVPCQSMAPALEELNEELRGKAIVKFVDVRKNTDAAADFPLRVIPTQFFFEADGNPYVPDSADNDFIMYEHKETGVHAYTAHEGAMDKDALLAVLKEMGAE